MLEMAFKMGQYQARVIIKIYKICQNKVYWMSKFNLPQRNFKILKDI